MALASYSNLKASLADWLNRDDLTSVIPDFISLARGSGFEPVTVWIDEMDLFSVHLLRACP